MAQRAATPVGLAAHQQHYVGAGVQARQQPHSVPARSATPGAMGRAAPQPRSVTPSRLAAAAAASPVVAAAAGYAAHAPPPLATPMGGYPQRGISPHRPPTPQGVNLGTPPRGARGVSPLLQRGVRPPPSPQRAPTPPAQLGWGFREATSVVEHVRARSRGRSPGARHGREAAYARGELVDYHSSSYQCWIPARVDEVEAETGAVKLNVKTELVSLRDQSHMLRPRTKPGRAQIEWVRSVMREGRIELEAQAMFRRLATRTEGHRHGVLRYEALANVASEMDRTLGISGSLRYLYSEFQQHGLSHLTFDQFHTVFWDHLNQVQQEWGRSLELQRQCDFVCEDPQGAYGLATARTLGEGTYGKVKLVRDRNTKDKRAVKIIDKRKHPGCLDLLAAEIENLCLLDHPHVSKLYEYTEDTSHLYLCMDFCSGGELQKKVSEARHKRQRIPEAYVADVMRQVLTAIAYVHARGVVHLDLKPANVMLMPNKDAAPPVQDRSRATVDSDFDKPHVVVIDLGVAQLFMPGNFRNNRPTGTPYTMAPEVWKGEITPKADIWSCGVMTYELLSCKIPVEIPYNTQDDALRFWANAPPINYRALTPASEDAVGACKEMMRLDRQARPNAADILWQKFLYQASSARASANADSVAIKHTLECLAKLPERSLLYMSVSLEVAKRWPANQNPVVKSIFTELNMGGGGRLERPHFIQGLKRFGLSDTRAQHVGDAIDLGRDGCIDWTTFVAACTDLGSLDFEDYLRNLFQHADSDSDGLLSQKDLMTILPRSSDDGLAKDIFQDLTGRTEAGARIDWNTFIRQFTGSKTTAKKGNSLPAPPGGSLRSAAQENPGFLGIAIDQVDKARSKIFPQPGDPKEEEANLKQLAQMGFTDKNKCLAALRRHRNQITGSCVEELCQL